MTPSEITITSITSQIDSRKEEQHTSVIDDDIQPLFFLLDCLRRSLYRFEIRQIERQVHQTILSAR